MRNGNNRIYLDFAASTPLDILVFDAMKPYWDTLYAHPWSAHSDGERVLQAIIEARTILGHALGIEGSITEKEIVFTGSGTESNTLALKGVLEYVEYKRGSLARLHILVGSIEHPSVREIGVYAQEKGMDVEYIPVTQEGIIDTTWIKSHLRPETVLVTVQYVNSEIGTIQPLKDIAKLLKEFKKEKGAHIFDREENVLYPLFHSDASQACMWLSCNVHALGVDLLTLDAHKMYGPKGIGALYVRKGVPLKQIFLGTEGHSYRPGTPAVPLIAGFARAVQIGVEEREENKRKVSLLRDYFIQTLKDIFPKARINGSLIERVANNVSVTFPGINHEFLQVQLDERGISVATRSACLEEGGEGSYVVSALRPEDRTAIRITLGKETTREEVDKVIEELKDILLTQAK